VRRTLATVALHAVLLAAAAATLLPIVWMVVASFMPAGEASRRGSGRARRPSRTIARSSRA
jgi:ABC-type glycerol-3-phosphate transport system permease component